MTVTKRGLLKVIILLVIANVIAGVWYYMVCIESSGESHDLWQDDHERATIAAETVDNTTLPDTFDIVSTYSYFVTQQPIAQENTGNQHLVSVKAAKLRIPVSINGNDSIDRFKEAICDKAFGHSSSNLEKAARDFTSTPQFNNNIAVPYNRVNTLPQVPAEAVNNQRIVAYPLLTSTRLLVMEIDHKHTNGNTSHTASTYVHYDRLLQRVLKRSDILSNNNDRDLLGVINAKIEALNAQNHLQLLKASRVPYELNVKRTGVAFIFAPGEIAPFANGEIEVLVQHSTMKKFLNQSFLNVINDSQGWWNYKKLE